MRKKDLPRKTEKVGKCDQSFHQSFNSSCKTKLQTRALAVSFHFRVETESSEN